LDGLIVYQGGNFHLRLVGSNFLVNDFPRIEIDFLAFDQRLDRIDHPAVFERKNGVIFTSLEFYVI